MQVPFVEVAGLKLDAVFLFDGSRDTAIEVKEDAV
jgi:hypothetical protein